MALEARAEAMVKGESLGKSWWRRKKRKSRSEDENARVFFSLSFSSLFSFRALSRSLSFTITEIHFSLSLFSLPERFAKDSLALADPFVVDKQLADLKRPGRRNSEKMRHSLAGTARPRSGVAGAAAATHHAPRTKSTVVVARAAPRGGASSSSGGAGGSSSPPSRVEVLKKEKELLQETLAAAAQATDQLAGALQVSLE